MAERWTRASLEGLVGASESLTLEFKSYRALLATGGKVAIP